METKIFSALFILSVSFNSSASLIDVTFNGEINSIRKATCIELDKTGYSPRCKAWDSEYQGSSSFYKDVLLELGDIFSGVAVIDPSKDFSMSSDGYQAIYSDATLTSEINVGGITLPNEEEPYSSIGNSVSIVHGRYRTDLLNVSTWYSGAEYFASFNLYLHDRDNVAFSDFSIPLLLDLDLFEVNSLDIAFIYRPTGDQLHIDASLNTFSYVQRATAVGEPPFGAAFLFYCINLIAFKRFKSRKQ